MTGALPAARSALSRLVLATLLLAGALSVLGAVTLEVARAAAAASVRDGAVAGGERARGTGAHAASGRGTAESGPAPVRVLLRAAVATAGAVVVPDPETGAAGAATPVLARPLGSTPGARPWDGHRARPVGGVSDRAPPRTAGT